MFEVKIDQNVEDSKRLENKCIKMEKIVRGQRRNKSKIKDDSKKEAEGKKNQCILKNLHIFLETK